MKRSRETYAGNVEVVEKRVGDCGQTEERESSDKGENGGEVRADSGAGDEWADRAESEVEGGEDETVIILIFVIFIVVVVGTVGLDASGHVEAVVILTLSC